jgi:calcineurin-like phosphoesterase family protein
MIYFTADTHFCHGNIIGSCVRPFNDVDEMNRTMIERWNSLVTDMDEIYILGDFMYKGSVKEANRILSILKGKKYLIKGNHDKYLDLQDFNQRAFEWVKDYFVLKYDGTHIILFHYPMLSWYGSHHGSIHLYGHVHNSVEKYPEFAEKIKTLGNRAINVGVDVNNFYPMSVKEIFNKINSPNSLLEGE